VSLIGPAKVIDGSTIVVADQLVRLHGIDAPELDQPFSWQGQKLMAARWPWPPLRLSQPGSKSAQGGRAGPAGPHRRQNLRAR
jgi:hypothetical protein